MRVDRSIPTNVLPSSHEARSETQPYYIVAPAYDYRSAGIRVLHQLCSLLNQLGYEAYVETPATEGSLWTPQLTPQIKAAHYLAGKKPIVVYPEVVKGLPMGLGIPVRYVLNYPGYLGGGDKSYSDRELVFTFDKAYFPDAPLLFLPVIDLSEVEALRKQGATRRGVAYYHNRYTKAGGVLRDFGSDAIEISSSSPANHNETLRILSQVTRIYCYESSAIIAEAILLGCPVVLMPNAWTLKEKPEYLITHYDGNGVAWGDTEVEISKAKNTVEIARKIFLEITGNWISQLENFIQTTQLSASSTNIDDIWPQNTIDSLPLPGLTETELCARSDREKLRRLSRQFKQWRQRSSIREVDAQIYAEHLAKGHVKPLAVVVNHISASDDDLADTLDALGECLGTPRQLIIVSSSPVPSALAESEIFWVAPTEFQKLDQLVASVDWVLVMRAGVRLEPHALMEWGLAPETFPAALMAYSDEALAEDGSDQGVPHFKPDLNVELLRCSNYLGATVLVRSDLWLQANMPVSGAALYRSALAVAQGAGMSGIAHIDSILYTSPLRLEPGQEAAEFEVAKAVIQQTLPGATLHPTDRVGSWQVRIPAPAGDPQVSMVVPSGIQTGYLGRLLETTHCFAAAQVLEVLVVCEPDQRDEVDWVICKSPMAGKVRVIEQSHQDSYNHSSALNAGVRAAQGRYVLVCDDDVEFVHNDPLGPLIGFVVQPDVGCVAPRLVTAADGNGRILGGPSVLGILGTVASYLGETQRLGECGVFSRLQLNQDVSTAAGHCFLFKRDDWHAVNGFDEKAFGLYFSVLDFTLRLNQQGRRHVWTPMVTVLHHGGKTIEAVRRDKVSQLSLAARELVERNELHTRWARELANDRFYSRHLSLFVPYDVEADIVVDWQPRRHERKRALGIPLRSGAGQYRMIEPLNALQDEGIAQSSVILPLANGATRMLQPLELVRAAPDVLVLQHSVDDGHLSLISEYRRVLPQVRIVQLVDDLLGMVPEKHPNRDFQSREGHTRMVAALRGSDRLIVTTQPLKEHYGKYVSDVHVIPNTLSANWYNLKKPSRHRDRERKLRVGWVGAGQHKGDLEMIEPVIRALADEVDWIFMGMATDGIRPLLKEFHGFVSFANYPETMASLDLDIAIAPLEDNFFNECKSNLRLLEYGAMGWPVVCSDMPPYRTDSPPVLLCSASSNDWVAALRKLIKSKSLRMEMGTAINKWVRETYYIKEHVHSWYTAMFD